MKQLILNLLALGSLISSILVITSSNPVIAVLFLISVFVNAAGYLLLTGIGFLGISYIIIYIGAITVLFLFVIMLLNIRIVELIETSNQYTRNLPLAIIIGGLFLYQIFTVLPFSTNDLNSISFVLNLINHFNAWLVNTDMTNLDVFNSFDSLPDIYFTNYLQIQSLGHVLYTFAASWLIVTSLVLLLAMVAPILLSNKNS